MRIIEGQFKIIIGCSYTTNTCDLLCHPYGVEIQILLDVYNNVTPSGFRQIIKFSHHQIFKSSNCHIIKSSNCYLCPASGPIASRFIGRRKVRATQSIVLPNRKALKSRKCTSGTDSATENKLPRRIRSGEEKVKRWSKSPPLRWRHRRHGKPYELKGQISHDPVNGSFLSRFVGVSWRVG